MSPSVVGIDLGGTKILGALVDADGGATPRVVQRQKRSTPAGSTRDVVDEIASVVHALHPAPVAVGIGTPGLVAPGSAVVRSAHNIPGFDGPVPLGDLVAERVGAPVVVANDVNAAAVGEARAGAAIGHPDVVTLWLGTGLGAGLVLDGRLRVGPNGLTGELGHTVVVPGGRRCPCGGDGHLEAYIGRRAMEQRARELHRSGRPTTLVERAGDGPMKSKVFRLAYDEGDDVAVELVDEGLAMLGLAAGNLVLAVDLGAVVVGGGLGQRFAEIVVERLTASFSALRYLGVPPAVLRSGLGDDAGAVGAALLATDRAAEVA